MSDSKPTCPTCGSQHTVKNGRIHNKKSKYQCQDCGRQFVKNTTQKNISQSPKNLIDKLLIEKISLAGIARVTGGAEPWLQKYVKTKYAKVTQLLFVFEKHKGKLTIECDEAGSFVGNKNNKQWIWLVLDKKTREIVGIYIGDRSKELAAFAVCCEILCIMRSPYYHFQSDIAVLSGNRDSSHQVSMPIYDREILQSFSVPSRFSIYSSVSVVTNSPCSSLKVRL